MDGAVHPVVVESVQGRFGEGVLQFHPVFAVLGHKELEVRGEVVLSGHSQRIQFNNLNVAGQFIRDEHVNILVFGEQGILDFGVVLPLQTGLGLVVHLGEIVKLIVEQGQCVLYVVGGQIHQQGIDLLRTGIGQSKGALRTVQQSVCLCRQSVDGVDLLRFQGGGVHVLQGQIFPIQIVVGIVVLVIAVGGGNTLGVYSLRIDAGQCYAAVEHTGTGAVGGHIGTNGHMGDGGVIGNTTCRLQFTR